MQHAAASGISPEPPPAARGAPGPLVLVVDDFDDNRTMYAEYLSRCGYEVDQAADGKEAVELARKRVPDVIVMDLSLPVMDGWQATRLIKSDARTCDIAIIALTGYSATGYPREARDAGCDAYLEKPCLPELLAEKVHELVRGGKARAPH